MKAGTKHHPFPTRGGCRRTRLAESSIASVDVCTCGKMHLHIGALTLRMAPSAVSELLATLGQAVARHAATGASPDAVAAAVAFGSNGRGEA